MVIGSLVIAPMVIVAGCGEMVPDAATTTTTTTTTSTTASTTSTSTTTSTTTTTRYPVSGLVQFYMAGQPGISGGVTITCTNDSITAVATADSVSGTYEATIPPGTYTLSANKSGWTIPSITVEVTSEAVVNSNFIANPTSWEVLRIGTEPLNSIVLAGASTGATDYIFAVGGDPVGNAGCVIRAASPYTFWESVNRPNSDLATGLLYVSAFDTIGLYILDRFASQFNCTDADAATLAYGADLGTLTIPHDLLYKLAFTAANRLTYAYTGKDSKKLYYKGATATTTLEAAAGSMLGVAKYDASNVIAVGEAGKAYLADTSDPTAALLDFQTQDNLSDVAYDSSGANAGGFIVTQTGTIIRLASATSYWVEVSGIPYPLTGAYIGATQASGLVCGYNGLVMKHR